MGSWTSEYLAYAAEGKRSPEEQMVLDAFIWPGGKMAGFIFWSSSRATLETNGGKVGG
jgi:hypothetical protein